MKSTSRIYIIFCVLAVSMLTFPSQESQAKSITSLPAFYGNDFGYYKSFLYGDNVLTGDFFKDKINGVVTLTNNGVFTYEQIDLLKISGGITIKGPVPNFRVYLLFTDKTTGEQKKFVLCWKDYQDDLYLPIVASVPLYQIGYNSTFQIIVHQENPTSALANKLQLLFEGVDL